MTKPKKDPLKHRQKEYATKRMNRLAAKLAAVEDYHATVPAQLRRLLENKATPDDILQFAASLAAARLVTELSSSHAGTAMDAAKQILDRSQGKAIERIQQHHKFEQLSDEQLDALVISKLKEVSDGSPTE